MYQKIIGIGESKERVRGDARRTINEGLKTKGAGFPKNAFRNELRLVVSTNVMDSERIYIINVIPKGGGRGGDHRGVDSSRRNEMKLFLTAKGSQFDQLEITVHIDWFDLIVVVHTVHKRAAVKDLAHFLPNFPVSLFLYS